MKIRFLGTHNTESKHTKLVTFLIDDILAVEAGSLTSELTFAEQEKVKAILITHGHYDHIKDLPSFAFGNSSRRAKVFGNPETLEIFSSHLADGLIYPEFSSDNSFLAKSVLELCPVEPLHPFDICGYRVFPVSVQHPISAVGFEITKGSKKILYTGDTGSGLTDIWQHVSPNLLIIDLTFPNRLRDVARDSGHLCAEMLKNELIEFQRIKGFLPRVSLVHMTPQYESQIEKEIKDIADKLPVSINLAAEGTELII